MYKIHLWYSGFITQLNSPFRHRSHPWALPLDSVHLIIHVGVVLDHGLAVQMPSKLPKSMNVPNGKVTEDVL